MVDYESALAIANLTQEEVDAIAHHEDMTAFAAMEMGNYLCETPRGERRLKRIPRRDQCCQGARRPRRRREAPAGGQTLCRDAPEGGVSG